MDISTINTQDEWLMADSTNISMSAERFRAMVEVVEEKERDAAAARKKLEAWADLLRMEGHGQWVPANFQYSKRDQHSAQGDQNSKRTREPARVTWQSEVMRVLAQYPDGATNRQVRDGVSGGEMGLRGNPNAFYTAVSRLAEEGKLVKSHDRLFDAELFPMFEERLKRGEVVLNPQNLSAVVAPGTIRAALIEYLESHPEGATMREIAKDVVAAGKAPHSGSVQNNLSKLIMRDLIRREGRKYYPLEKKEPPQNGAAR